MRHKETLSKLQKEILGKESVLEENFLEKD